MSESYDIGACLIEARITQGLSQRELANRLGLHQQQVARWEREGYRRVALSRLSAVAGLLGVYLSAEVAAPLTVSEARAAYSAAGEATVFLPPVAPVADLGGVVSRLRASAADLQLRFGVSMIAVYGSFARGEQRPDSDVDLIVQVADPTMERVFGAERALGRILGREVQLGSLDSINPRVRSSVEEDLVHVWPT
jgi:predicted nucleotidyltransferase/transposase-like protein